MSDEQHILNAIEASFAVASSLSKIENPALQARARAAIKQQMISDERLVALLDSLEHAAKVGS